MPQRKHQIRHAEIVRLFASRLRELRHSRGLTQTELAQKAHVTVTYVGRLEAGKAAPGIDLVQRLAVALGTTIADLLPTSVPPDTLVVLQEQAQRLFGTLLKSADQETLLMLNPLLARLVEASARSH